MCKSTSTQDREVLPTNVTPTHYNVTIVPGLESFKFSGQVSVSLTVNESTKTITANAHDVTVSKASVVIFRVNPGGLDKVSHWPKDPNTHRSVQEAKSITYNKDLQTVIFEFEHEIPAVSNIILHAEFEGNHNDQMAGFYRSGYTDKQGVKKHLVVTQFEATDCRRCFPCWDEPALKATFDVTLYVPEDKIALSNMHAIEESLVSFNDHKLKCVKFARTPIMSTYLLAMCVGEFDYVEAVATPKAPADARPIKCRVYTLPGQKEMGVFGLDVCVKTLEYFSEYFDIAYPLPKMDMVAIPDFGAGAMENWGLVTYRETALLYDPSKSSASAKERVAYVVCHELAHQWFGNLVTMSWWNELWLNEGFATAIGWQAVDHVFPEWNVFVSFLNGEFASGQKLDSMRSSHPIEVEVKSPTEISQIFDAISYSKGASVIRMLNNYLGVDVFAEGVRKYLKKHQYGNAKTVDLWAALSESSGHDVARLMFAWTRKIGYPMVTITGEKYDADSKQLTLELEQKRFLATGDLKAEEDDAESVWFVPVAVLSSAAATPTVHLLDQKKGSISFPYEQAEGAYYKLNAGVSGFFRVNYSEEQVARLSNALRKNLLAFSTSDRIGIITDVFAFARAGLGFTSSALEILRSFESEEDQMVLSEIQAQLSSLKRAWYKKKSAIEGLNALQRLVFSPKVDSLGFDYPPNEDHMNVLKRNLVISACAAAGDEKVVAELKSRFEKYAQGDSKAFHPNLRDAVFCTVLNTSSQPEKDFDVVFKIYMNPSTADERITALNCLGATNDMNLVHKILNEYVLNADIVKLQDVPSPIASLAIKCPHKEQVYELLWTWVKANWTVLHEKLSSTMSLLGRVLQYTIMYQVGDEFAKKVEEWAAGEGLPEAEKALRIKQVKDAKRPLEQGLENLRSSTQWFTRDESAVADWLSTNGFVSA